METEAADQARQARATLLAKRSGQTKAFASVEEFSTMNDQIYETDIDNEEYLIEAGLNPDEMTDALDTDRSANKNQRQIVLDAINTLDEPTVEKITTYATDRNVSKETVETILEKLVTTGTVTRTGDTYRQL